MSFPDITAEINDMFADLVVTDTNDVMQALYQESPDTYLLKPSQKDTERGRISTLSEMFLEWYLFDSNDKKDIKTFLETENLTDTFTENEFMDLMCGNAYLDRNLLSLILLKLPFYLKPSHIQWCNDQVKRATPSAYIINPPDDLFEQIKTELQSIKQKRKEQKAKRDHERYIQNPEKKRAYSRQYAKDNPEKILQNKRRFWARNKDRLNEQRRQHREEHPEEIRAQARQSYHNNLDKRRAYDKERRQDPKRKAYMQAYHKKRAKEKPEDIQKQKKAWYEANKERLTEQAQQKHQEMKQKQESAKKICAAYVFLLNLRRHQKPKFLELYTAQANPLIGMLKICPALQNLDINMCPFCNPDCGNTICECCNEKALSLPNALPEIQRIATELTNQR